MDLNETKSFNKLKDPAKKSNSLKFSQVKTNKFSNENQVI